MSPDEDEDDEQKIKPHDNLEQKLATLTTKVKTHKMGTTPGPTSTVPPELGSSEELGRSSWGRRRRRRASRLRRRRTRKLTARIKTSTDALRRDIKAKVKAKVEAKVFEIFADFRGFRRLSRFSQISAPISAPKSAPQDRRNQKKELKKFWAR